MRGRRGVAWLPVVKGESARSSSGDPRGPRAPGRDPGVPGRRGVAV